MRRALFVAGDRGLTRLHAEALLGRELEAHPAPGEGWAAARAHSGLEARVLIEHGARPFDVVVIAPRLPDVDGLDLIRELRELDATREVPVFLLTERGRDAHSRRIAAARYRVAGFIELPAAPGNIRAALEQVQRRRRVLIIDPRPEEGERYRAAFERGGFVPELLAAPRDARRRARSFDPDLSAVALLAGEDERAPEALEICASLKRLDHAPKVLLYGPLSALPSALSIDDNAERADDFVKAPFDDELLVARAAALVGVGGTGGGSNVEAEPSDGSSAPETRLSEVDLPSLVRRASDRRASSRGRRLALPRETARRGHRRVPCDVSLEGEADGRAFFARTLDISHGGMFFALDPPFAEGTRLRMRFELPSEGLPIEAEGRVAWVGAGPEGSSGMGVEFAAISEGDLERIVTYVNRLSGVLYEP